MSEPRTIIELIGFEDGKARQLRRRIFEALDKKTHHIPEGVAVAIIPGEVKAWPAEPGDKMAPYIIVRGTDQGKTMSLAQEIGAGLEMPVGYGQISFFLPPAPPPKEVGDKK
ncbi:MAG: hypothetical protein WCV68_01940 [Candidatus Paceibacterota bacterium]|jgi:hypothetical protein